MEKGKGVWTKETNLVPISSLHNKHLNQRTLILGNGPSLEALKFDEIADDILVIGMHRTWRWINPPYHIILCRKEYFQELFDGLWTPEGIIVTKLVPLGHLGQIPGVRTANVRGIGTLRHRGEVSYDLEWGSASSYCGHFAIEAAVWLGCNPIYLIGYDGQSWSGHAFDVVMTDRDKDPPDRSADRDIMRYAASDLAIHRPNVRTYNCNPQSAFTDFPHRSLEEIYK